LSVYQLAERYGVCVASIYAWTEKAWMPASVKLGGRRYWWADEISAWEAAGFPRDNHSRDRAER
jgi:predicted DNA-binding transcriptional regulator AlpA